MSFAVKFADAIRALHQEKKRSNLTSAIIVAAGNSTRMGTSSSKQLLKVGGVPVLARTLLAFQKAPQIAEIVLVARREDFPAMEALVKEYDIKKLTFLAEGGATRAQSVEEGFKLIDDSARFVAIHDGARCLVTPQMIEKVTRAAYRHNAATAAAPVSDTVKIADSRGFIKETVNRDKVFLATTPQVFHTSLYRGALMTVKVRELLTDDNQLIEKLPYPVKLVDCGRENIKITHPEDLALAELILKEREEAR